MEEVRANFLAALNLLAFWLIAMGFMSKKPAHRPYYLSAGVAGLAICTMLLFGGG
jgi:hypothetical protein